MRISNPSSPSVPEGVQVDELALDADALTITARTTAARPHCGRWELCGTLGDGGGQAAR